MLSFLPCYSHQAIIACTIKQFWSFHLLWWLQPATPWILPCAHCMCVSLAYLNILAHLNIVAHRKPCVMASLVKNINWHYMKTWLRTSISMKVARVTTLVPPPQHLITSVSHVLQPMSLLYPLLPVPLILLLWVLYFPDNISSELLLSYECTIHCS